MIHGPSGAPLADGAASRAIARRVAPACGKFAPMEPTEDDEAPSKTQRKKTMIALQKLGEELVALSNEQLAHFDLPETLREAVVAARRITQHEARRRQGQYIGKLMREIDAEDIRARLDRIKGVSAEATAHLHLLERWRDRLLAEEPALEEFAVQHPGCDVQHLRQLIRNARREREAGKPPKAFRQIYQLLKDLIPSPPSTTGSTSDES